MLNGNPISFSQSGCSSSGNAITISVGTVGAGQTITITMHMDYALKYGYTGRACTSGSPTRCSSTAFNHGYSFHTSITFNGQSTPLPMTDANVGIVGKVVTAIGGFLTDTNGNPKSNLEIVTYAGKGVCPSAPPSYAGDIIVYSDMSGWYFVTLPSSGWYTSCIYNSVGQLKHSASVSLSTNQFVEVDVNNLQPSDPIIMGEIVTSSGMPLSVVSVELIGANGKILASTTTNGAGEYVFRFSQPGTYTVLVIPPAGFSCLSSCSVTISLSQFQTAYVNFAFVAKTTQ
jgi:hypothetical protein